ncbi:SPOR domain-containing protein [Marinimicrobium alkaliphilum]|uniref:SPOR domain-containing protein n=1 Tax=Marinimicrobium alkaliphilum TaxID=2202654 RepID=UPI000DBA4FBD|nr:SPOR domain-containing protein [Marinimicrobium alkaliphilum]
MTRDYAKKNRRRAPTKKKSQVPGWVWLFTGCVLGAFVMFLIYLWELPEPSDEPRTASVSAPETQTQRAAEPEPSRPKPRFDFYKLLRDSEEIVPATEPEQPLRNRSQPQDSAPSSPAERVEYILQVGSFRNPTDADRLRAELLLLNLNAYTEQVNIRDGELWHRVLVGPFDNQSRLASARSTLVSNEFNALVLKRAPE